MKLHSRVVVNSVTVWSTARIVAVIGYDVTGGERIKETRHRAIERNDEITNYSAILFLFVCFLRSFD